MVRHLVSVEVSLARTYTQSTVSLHKYLHAKLTFANVILVTFHKYPLFRISYWIKKCEERKINVIFFKETCPNYTENITYIWQSINVLSGIGPKWKHKINFPLLISHFYICNCFSVSSSIVSYLLISSGNALLPVTEVKEIFRLWREGCHSSFGTTPSWTRLLDSTAFNEDTLCRVSAPASLGRFWFPVWC
jgi:hypothetical protein